MSELVTNFDQLRAMMEELFATFDKNISEWELDFLDNVYDNRSVMFSDNEMKKINEIYDKYMS